MRWTSRRWTYVAAINIDGNIGGFGERWVRWGQWISDVEQWQNFFSWDFRMIIKRKSNFEWVHHSMRSILSSLTNQPHTPPHRASNYLNWDSKFMKIHQIKNTKKRWARAVATCNYERNPKVIYLFYQPLMIASAFGMLREKTDCKLLTKSERICMLSVNATTCSNLSWKIALHSTFPFRWLADR